MWSRQIIYEARVIESKHPIDDMMNICDLSELGKTFITFAITIHAVSLALY